MMRDKIGAEGAKGNVMVLKVLYSHPPVVVHGAVWSEANDFAIRLANQEGAALIHPFDDPEVRG